MKTLRVLLLTLISAIALAAGQTATVSWAPPPTYLDGSPLPATDIASYTLSWSGGPTGSQTVTSTTTTVPIPCGSVNFSVTVTTTAQAKYPNVTSSPDGPVPYASGIGCTPNPPTGLTAK